MRLKMKRVNLRARAVQLRGILSPHFRENLKKQMSQGVEDPPAKKIKVSMIVFEPRVNQSNERIHSDDRPPNARVTPLYRMN